MLFRHRNIISAYVLFSFVASTATVSAQPLKRLNSVSYNVNEGLLHSSATDIAEDGNRCIWISAGNGVQRFDGRTFHTIGVSNDNTGIPDDKYVKFFRLKNGNLWLRHSRGISEYDIHTNRFRNVFVSEESDVDSTPTPFWEDDYVVWSQNPKGICCIDKKTFAVTTHILVPSQKSYSNIIAASSESRSTFLLLREKEVYIVEPNSKNHKTITPDSKQKSFLGIVYYKPDTVLIATKRGIEKMDIHSGKFTFICPYKTKSPSWITSIYIKLHALRNNRYIVSEGPELFELDMVKNNYISKLVNLQNNDFVDVGFISNFFSDSYNQLWIVTANNGIRKVRYQFGGFKYYGLANKRKNFVKTLYVDKKENRVLCASLNHGLLIFDTAQQLFQTIDHLPGVQPPLTISAIRKIAPHRYLLFLTGTRLVYIFNTADLSLQKIQIDTSGVGLNNVFDYHMTIFPISESESILQNSYYVYQIKWQPPATVYFEKRNLLPAPSISSYMDPHHRLWIGSIGKYFLFASGIDGFKTFDLKKKIIVRCFYEAKEGSIWMGTEKGLYQLDNEGNVVKIFDKGDGLPDENIYVIREDKIGNLWFSHNKGISCMKRHGGLLHFNKEDGLQENEFNTNTFFESPDGELFYGGVNGITSFYPEDVLRQNYPPKLLVTSIKVKEKEWKNDTATWNISEMWLPHFQNSISLEFNAIGSRSTDQYNYQYRMKGAEENWTNSSNRGVAHYVLPPGKYKFEVYAGNSFDKNAVPMKEISLFIQPPFWRTGWFIAIVVVCVAAITIFITRYLARLKLKRRIAELERKREVDQERLRISREMHDDIGAGLTQITLMTEAAKSKKLERDQLDEIADTSRKLVGNMSEIIWSMNPENNTLDQTLSYLREQLHHLLEYSGINYTLNFPENGSSVTLNNSQRRNLLLVTKEIVHNAIKHSKARNITVDFQQKNSSLHFMIHDDGHGFDMEKTSKGNGLRNIRKRIEDLNGTLEIKAEPGTGTMIKYEIPLK